MHQSPLDVFHALTVQHRQVVRDLMAYLDGTRPPIPEGRFLTPGDVFPCFCHVDKLASRFIKSSSPGAVLFRFPVEFYESAPYTTDKSGKITFFVESKQQQASRNSPGGPDLRGSRTDSLGSISVCQFNHPIRGGAPPMSSSVDSWTRTTLHDS